MAAAISPLSGGIQSLTLDFRRWLRLFPPFTLVLFLVPIFLGLVGTILPSFGYLPGAGGGGFSFEPWRALARAPGLTGALHITLLTGFGSTILALGLAFAISAAWHGTAIVSRMRRWLAPLLAVPHAAFALGFAFLLAPSGWLMRLVSPWLSGWTRPPDFLFVQDPNGLALLLALVCKEVFFLLLMIWACLAQVDADRLLRVGRVLGYRPVASWCKIVLPLVYRQIRLPIYAVLAYGLSVVDMAIILGPTTPPTLSMLTLTWFLDPSPIVQLRGAAGAVFLFGCVVASIGVWRATEHLIARGLSRWVAMGGRGFAETTIRWTSGFGGCAVLLVMIGALLGLLAWSAAGVWRFPSALPTAFSIETWIELWPGLSERLLTTTILALTSSIIAVVIAIGCLENECWSGTKLSQRSLTILYLPLVVPQISFLFGLQVVFVVLNVDGTWAAVILSHLIFVLPYVFLVLSDPYRSLDSRYARAASSLGASPLRVFWKIRAPLLLGAIAIAFAIGVAVSVTQYVATVFPGAGRFSTLTTEAVISMFGGNRRVAAVYGLSQFMLPLIIFGAATLLAARRSAQLSGVSK